MTKEANDTVTVVILTKNSANTLEACLKSILRQRPGEVFAVDATSTDATLTILRNYGIRAICDPYGSLSYSRQQGVNSASGEYVMFVDSDVELADGCIATLRLELQRFGWVGIHARLLSAENVSYWQRGQDEAFSRYYGTVGPKHRIDTITALFRRDILLKYPFDPFFIESCEDVDLCRRLTAANQGLGVSSAIAYHHHRRTFFSFVRQRLRNGIGTVRLSLKYGEREKLVDPLITPLSLIIRNIASRRVEFVAFWFVSGVAEFLGVLYGLKKIGRASNIP